MGATIGQVLSFGVGVALSPIPIIGVVLMLATPRARTNGPAFIVGWVFGLALAGTIVLLAAGGSSSDDSGGPSQTNATAELVFGALLIVVAARQWRGRPRPGQDAEMPKWMASVDQFGPPKAAGLAVLLSAVNPKNLLLVAGAASAIAQTGAPASDQAVALIVFVLIGTLGPGVPVAIYFGMGERSKSILDGLKTWMMAHNAAIMVAICLVIAAKLIGDGITALSA